MPATPTLDDLRRYAVARTLFADHAADRDPAPGLRAGRPIRALARAQDLTLRHRVKDYRAGDLERRHTRLPVEEDCLVNYGFLPREHLALMHPRVSKREWDAETHRRAADVLAFVRERGSVHPREVDQAFAHGRVTNYWGGTSNASTHLLDGMHYRGMLRVQRRDSGTRIYAVADHAEPDSSEQAQIERAAALIDLVVRKYAPLPSASLTIWCACWAMARRTWPSRAAGMAAARYGRAMHRMSRRTAGAVRPGGGDRRRFELLWDWVYKFEAYTPAPKRQYGYYAPAGVVA